MSSVANAVILTYHRIPNIIEANPKFHDLPFDRFKRQMEFISTQDTSSQTKPNISITFDDSTSDHFEAGNFMTELGLTGTFFVITGRLGQKGYLTQEQVLHLAKNGHRIGSHTVSHRQLTKLKPKELDQELLNSKSFLEDLTQQKVDWIAPPGGIYNNAVFERALTLGYSVVRTMEWGYTDMPLKGRVPCFPILAINHHDFFQKILAGKASIWPYVLKDYFKRTFGETIYNKIRKQWSPLNKQVEN